MPIHNPNNWHWVNKDVREWAKEYLEKSLVGISAEQGDVTAKVSKILSMDGDVDVSQRKGKVITLFDVKLQLEYEGMDFHSLRWKGVLRCCRHYQRRRRCWWNHHGPGGCP
jgi:activator of HSP90 ATPase